MRQRYLPRVVVGISNILILHCRNIALSSSSGWNTASDYGQLEASGNTADFTGVFDSLGNPFAY